MDLFNLTGLAIVGVACVVAAAVALLVDHLEARASERRDREAEADADQSGQE